MTVDTAYRNQKASGSRREIYCPMPIFLIKARNTFYCIALGDQTLGQRPTFIKGRRAFVAKVFDLLIAQTTFGMQLLPVFLGKR